MVQQAAQCHQFGSLAVMETPDQAFDIVQVRGDGTALAVARIEVDESAFPTLRINRLDPEERHLEAPSAFPVEHAVLVSRRGDHATCFDLTVSGCDDRLEIRLSGDHRCMAGDRHYRLFWWSAECHLEEGELFVHGPHLANDIDS